MQESSICNGRTVAANLSSKSASSKESIDGEKPISPRRKTGGEEEELNDSEMIRWPESFVFTNVPVNFCFIIDSACPSQLFSDLP